MKKVSLALASVGALVSAVPAQADVMDAVYNFEASFTSGPNANIYGTFTISLDPKDSLVPVTFKSFSSRALTGYKVSSSISGRLVVIGNCGSDGCGVNNGQSQFYYYTSLNTAGDAVPYGSGLVYAAQGKEGIFYANRVTVSRVISAVPEPATWAMMILGFGVVGYAMRRKTVLRYV